MQEEKFVTMRLRNLTGLINIRYALHNPRSYNQLELCP